MSANSGQIGPYQISRELGRGGMGVVYLARDSRLERDVAIKALPEELAEDADRLARFQREAKVLAQLNHPNIAGIYGVEEANDQQYLVLEYIEGETLADRLDRGALAVDDALEIAVQIAAGVEAAHEAGVIHRDLKPGNIMVTADGSVKVLDFGLAHTEEARSSSIENAETVRQSSPARHSPTIPGAERRVIWIVRVCRAMDSFSTISTAHAPTLTPSGAAMATLKPGRVRFAPTPGRFSRFAA